jgi:hypothetical protein
MNVRYHAVYAISVPAIKKERVNSVENGDTNQRGTKKSHHPSQLAGEKR